MKLVDYLGLALKSHAVLELLRDYDARVVYELDVLQEGQPDSYSVGVGGAGFQLRFDADQILNVIWCYVTPTPRFFSVDPNIIGVPLYATLRDATTAASDLNVPFESRDNVKVPILGQTVSWAKLTFADHWRHYEYERGRLKLLTLMRQGSPAA